MRLSGCREDGGEAEPGQQEDEFLADQFDATSVPLLDHGDSFHFTVDGLDPPSFTVETAKITGTQDFVQHRGDDDHGLAALVFARSAAIEDAQDHAQSNSPLGFPCADLHRNHGVAPAAVEKITDLLPGRPVGSHHTDDEMSSGSDDSAQNSRGRIAAVENE